MSKTYATISIMVGIGASIALAQVSPPMAAEAAPWLIGVGTIAGAGVNTWGPWI
ncbi:hypothetical protein [Streptococcus mutans]|uniref:hypothetical protein n=1 Tax=Streptococcus mutans TaxID=1309 RepID=UPI00138AD236|nr:hypothetical protein [Streptococcus mutans]MCB4945773.1 hypothetical protein [Streptococcus mutans]MCB4949392.1 hypothetical protein [Streptococcus mutans]MCB4958802.1 hypothetical protein [Streptococcus mutans]MCB4960553.1 hypothetical protein [Streptococcus mutans]MCB4966639.1 hypothetical protein [Streptococcus mutans]